jgi:ankyrin repeat protein
VVALLLKKGADVNTRCGEGRTALMVAAGQNATTRDGIARLLNAGADPNLRDNDGNNAKDEAASAGRDELLDMFDAFQVAK